MKRICFLLFIVPFWISCEKELIEAPKRIAESNFYQTVDDLESASMGMYVPLKALFNDVYLVTLEGMTDVFVARDAMVDISQFQGLKGQNRFATEPFWANLYLTIRNANLILRYIGDTNKLNDEQKNTYIAEAKFMRALAYFHLVRVWGRVPLRTEDNMEVLEIPREATESVYQLIVDDLIFANTNLSEVQTIKGRADKWAAKTVLAEVYFTLGRYNEAAVVAEEVIESSKFSLVTVSSVNDFNNLYGPAATSSPEEIFYVHYSTQRTWNYMRYLGAGTTYLGVSGYHMITGRHPFPFFKEWVNGDLRKVWSTYDQNAREPDGTFRIICRKFRDPGSTQPRTDYPLYRYADVLLIYAEASCRAGDGPTDKGVEMLNRIKRRAYGADSKVPNASLDYKASDYNKDQFIDLVIRERGWETFGEGKRWFDLKRAGIYKERIKAVRDIDVDDAHVLWPIPLAELNFNEAMAGDQNYGY